MYFFSVLKDPFCAGIKIHQLLCLVNSNLVPCGPATILHLKHIASTVVELKCQVARITHRKPGGHIERKVKMDLLYCYVFSYKRDCCNAALIMYL